MGKGLKAGRRPNQGGGMQAQMAQVQAMQRRMAALQDEEGELYVQSPAYLYELMNTLPVDQE